MSAATRQDGAQRHGELGMGRTLISQSWASSRLSMSPPVQGGQVMNVGWKILGADHKSRGI